MWSRPFQLYFSLLSWQTLDWNRCRRGSGRAQARNVTCEPLIPGPCGFLALSAAVSSLALSAQYLNQPCIPCSLCQCLAWSEEPFLRLLGADPPLAQGLLTPQDPSPRTLFSSLKSTLGFCFCIPESFSCSLSKMAALLSASEGRQGTGWGW